jgi:hypothetical protein
MGETKKARRSKGTRSSIPRSRHAAGIKWTSSGGWIIR